MTQFAIHSIYRATEGEGIHLGIPQVFVRFQGCAVGCLNCDSKETWEFSAPSLNLEEVVKRVEKVSCELSQGEFPIKRVSITGGDPLHPKHEKAVIGLIQELKKKDYWINIEAAGTRVVEEIFDQVDFISFDVKTPSTGVKMSQKLVEKLIEQYSDKAQIKLVVEGEDDFHFSLTLARELKEKLSKASVIPWVLTPCFNPGEDFPKERISMITRLNETYGQIFRVISQQHKWVYGAKRMDV